MTLQLRPYQRAAIDAIYTYYQKHAGHALLVLPTASGKSLVMAAFIQGCSRSGRTSGSSS
jgi:DNA repair protein RadD